jgi:8-oxo-dGTP diphosphatase
MPFICRQTGGEIILKEHADYKWLDRKELLDLDWAEADVEVVREYLSIAFKNSVSGGS